MAQASKDTQPAAADQAAPADGKPLFPPSPPLPMRPLAKGRLKLICASACNFGNLHGAVLPAGTPFEHVFSEEFWANHAGDLRPNDQIDILSDDSRFYGRVYVRMVSGSTAGQKTRANVAKISYVEFDEAPVPASHAAAYRTEYCGPHKRWCVMRIADGKPVAENLESEEAAATQMKGLERSLVKAA